MENEEIKTLSETIIWAAKESVKKNPKLKINSVIHAISCELRLELCKFMKEHRSK